MPDQVTTPEAQHGARRAGRPACIHCRIGIGRMTEPPRGPVGPGRGV